MLNTPSVTTMARVHVLATLGEVALELVEIEVAVDALIGRARERDRIDDAVVIERIADDGGLVRDELRQHTHDGRIGRAEQHAGFAPVKLREPPLERDVRRPRAADEAHRARPGAVASNRLLLGGEHARIQRQPEVAVGVHAQVAAAGLRPR